MDEYDQLSVIDTELIAAGEDPLGIGAGTAPPGTYVLLFSVDAPATTTVGSLGTQTFEPGAYAYVGSAFGTGGLGRIDRHRRVAAGEHDVRHWHVDYLGGHGSVSLNRVIAAPNVAVECVVAAALDAASTTATDSVSVPLESFGSSDCACRSHLFTSADGESLLEVAREVVATAIRN